MTSLCIMLLAFCSSSVKTGCPCLRRSETPCRAAALLCWVSKQCLVSVLLTEALGELLEEISEAFNACEHEGTTLPLPTARGTGAPLRGRKVLWPTHSPPRGTPVPGIHKGFTEAVLVSLCFQCLMLQLKLPQGGETFAAQSWDRAEVTDFTSLHNLCWADTSNRTGQHFVLLWDLLTLHFFALTLLAVAVCSCH